MPSLSECRLESNNNVKITFDGGDLSSDGGLLLVKEFFHKFGVSELANRILMPVDSRRYAIHKKRRASSTGNPPNCRGLLFR